MEGIESTECYNCKHSYDLHMYSSETRVEYCIAKDFKRTPKGKHTCKCNRYFPTLTKELIEEYAIPQPTLH